MTVFGALTLLIIGVLAAWGYWSAGGHGRAVARAGTLTAPVNPAASAPTDSNTVSVSWGGAALGTGEPAQGYYVNRIRVSDGTRFQACGSSQSALIAVGSCDDTGVIDGTYQYVVTAVFGSWSAASARSNRVTVVNDSTLPSVMVTSISPTPNDDNLNNSSPVVVTLEASAGREIASITYTLDAEPAVTASESTAVVSVTGDGIHTISFSARDNAGNDSPTDSVLVRIDTVAPDAATAPTLTADSDSGSSVSDGITNVTTPTVTGTAEDGSVVTLLDGPTPVGSAVAVDGIYTILASALDSGSHALTARSTDTAGNTGPDSTATTIIIDTTAPAAPSVPTLTGASDSGSSSVDGLTNVTTPTLTGTAEDATTVTLLRGSTVLGTAEVDTGTYRVTSEVLTNGIKTLTVDATDVAGNVGPASASSVITIDIIAPGKPGKPKLTADSDTGRSASDRDTMITTPTITGSAPANTTVEVYDGSNPIGTVVATNTYSLIPAPLANGTHDVTARATDAAGNTGASSGTAMVIIDTVAPAAPSAPVLSAASDTGSSSTDRITKTTTPTFTGTNETKMIITLADGATPVGTETTSRTKYSVVSSRLTSGSHRLSATATDIAGNVGPSSVGTTIIIDTTAPAAPSAPTLTAASDTGASATDRLTRLTTPTFTGTAEDGATAALFDDTMASGTGVAVTGSAYTATTATLTSARHAITAKATDLAGNVSAASAATTITVDAIAPTVTVNQAADQSDPSSGPTIDFTVIFSEPVTGFAGADLTLGGGAGATAATVTGNGATYRAVVGGMTKTGSVQSSIAAGKAQDDAGNTNLASTAIDNTVTYTDTTAPTVEISSFAASTGQTHRVTVAGTAGHDLGDDTHLIVVLCTQDNYPCAAGDTTATLTGVSVDATTGAWTVTSAALGTVPELYARATQTDASANTTNSAVVGPVAVP
ncbi:MAG: Ig-like domain-containing protein [Propionibacteriaceae bacterium]